MNDWLAKLGLERFVMDAGGGMVHDGLPAVWVMTVLVCMLGLVIYAFVQRHHLHAYSISLSKVPVLGNILQVITRSPWLLLSLRILVVGVFLLVIAAGLFGTPIPERNIATTLTWTLWWTGVIIAIIFIGSAWCAVCPWDRLATWLVKRRLWKRGSESTSLGLRVPVWLRNVWPATLMFIGFTWLELGVGITTSPYATAILALIMVALAAIALAIFERKAFCRYMCPVGRTIGAYSDLAPTKLSPINSDTCANCTSLECFHGTHEIEPCPTHLVMGYLKTNTYCTSCGECSLSCPHENVNWRWQLNRVSDVAEQRINYSEASFILILVALTSFHGVTMLPNWEGMIQKLATAINDRSQLLISFSISMAIFIGLLVLMYTLTVKLTYQLLRKKIPQEKLYSLIALPLLPLAFTYHIAHNLTHLVRESVGLGQVFVNPFGHNALPLSMSELHFRHLHPMLPDMLTFGLQAGLLILGFWWAIRLLLPRMQMIDSTLSYRYVAIPATLFIVFICLFNLWLLMQPMVMRM